MPGSPSTARETGGRANEGGGAQATRDSGFQLCVLGLKGWVLSKAEK